MTSHEEIQADISARLDGEPGAIADDVYETHLANCPECREYLNQARRLQGLIDAPLAHTSPRSQATAQEDAPQPELTDLILEQVEPEWRRAASASWMRMMLARIALVVMAVVHVVWAVFLLADSAGYLPPPTDDAAALVTAADPLTGQLLVEAAAVRMALAAGLCFSAWRPQVLLGLLPVAGGLALFRIGFYVRDAAMGTAGPHALSSLVLLLVTAGVVLWGYLATARLRKLAQLAPAI